MESKRPFTIEDWFATPEPVRQMLDQAFRRIEDMEKHIELLEKRIEELTAQLNMNSRNSSKPPSSDPPFASPGPGGSGEKKKPGAKKGHKGHRQAFLPPTRTVVVRPAPCPCGCADFPDAEPYYTHQVIELPEIKPEVTHFVLYKAVCPACGEKRKAMVPSQHRTGYGPRASAAIVELAGTEGNSRSSVQSLCASLFGFPISLGAIQKVVGRSAAAILPHYEAIAEKTRSAAVAHVDETSHKENKKTMWLWLMAARNAALFKMDEKRSKKAFEGLIGDWKGTLVSDGYGPYRKWPGPRQTCLAHLIRDARALSERPDPETARFGKWAMEELQRLDHMAHSPPTVGEFRAFKARLCRLIARNSDRKGETGTFARRLGREMDCLWLFLEQDGVSPTNNHAERLLRYAVLWRKRSQGTRGEKGRRWVERVLSLRQTCRLNARKTFPTLVDALSAFFEDQSPDLAWIHQIGMATL